MHCPTAMFTNPNATRTGHSVITTHGYHHKTAKCVKCEFSRVITAFSWSFHGITFFEKPRFLCMSWTDVNEPKILLRIQDISIKDICKTEIIWKKVISISRYHHQRYMHKRYIYIYIYKSGRSKVYKDIHKQRYWSPPVTVRACTRSRCKLCSSLHLRP